MKRIISPAWTRDDRLRAIRAILEAHYENESGGLEAARLKAIWFITTEEPTQLNKRLEEGELRNYVETTNN